MSRRTQEEAAARWARAALEGRSPVASAASAMSAPSNIAPAGRDVASELPPETWTELWAELDLPPAEKAPADFSRRLERAWREERERVAAPLLGAAWMRAAAAAALLAGVALGGALSWNGIPAEAAEAPAAEEDSWETSSLSEEYLAALADADLTSADSTDGAAEAGGAVAP